MTRGGTGGWCPGRPARGPRGASPCPGSGSSPGPDRCRLTSFPLPRPCLRQRTESIRAGPYQAPPWRLPGRRSNEGGEPVGSPPRNHAFAAPAAYWRVLTSLTTLIALVAFVTRVAGLRLDLDFEAGAFGVTFFVAILVHLLPWGI